MSELMALLQDQGFTGLKSYHSGTDHRVICPSCGGGSTKEKSCALTLDQEGGAVWKCWRSNCSKPSGFIPSKRNIVNFRQRAYSLPVEHLDTDRSGWVDEYFAARKIGVDTLDDLGIYSAYHYQPEIEERIESIVFPFIQSGVLQRRKYRGIVIRDGNEPILERVVKKVQSQDKDSPSTLMNYDGMNNELVVWVEGETDVCAVYEAGIRSVVTLPDGSPSITKDNKPINLNDQRFLPLFLNKKRLDEVKMFILAGDQDHVGQRFMGAIEDILGPRRCKFVTWPHGCKDAGEVLMKHGPEAVRQAIESAQFSSKVGVVKTSFNGVIERMSEMEIPGLSLGIKELDNVFRLPAHGGMALLTGQPGRGKTSFTNWLMAQSILKYNWHWAGFAAEGYGGEGATINLMKTLAYLKLSHIPHPRLNDKELEEAYELTTKHVSFLDTKTDVNKRIQTILANVDWMREFKPIHGVLIDPFNAVEVNHGRTIFREDEQLNQILGMINDWSHDTNTFVLICVHPRTLRAGKDGKVAEITGYDLAGGAAFFNKTDAGYTISRTEEDHMRLTNWKARYPNWSKLGNAEVLYDWKTGLISDL